MTALLSQPAGPLAPTDDARTTGDRALNRARAAQTSWAATPVSHRLAILRALRHQIASRAAELGAALADATPRNPAETIVSEVLPLADACRFLERRARRLLRPKRPAALTRPLWLLGSRLRIHRDPLGVILIIAPGNYPLMLPSIQTIQALCAGNAVLLKPAPACQPIASLFADCLQAAGLPKDLLQLLPDDPAHATRAIEQRVDKIILTGSTHTGRRVLHTAADHLTPVTAELSGHDAAIIRHDADLDLTASALAFGLSLNAGETCIAPRRVLVQQSIAAALEARLKARLDHIQSLALTPQQASQIQPLLADALANGAQLLHGDADDLNSGPIVVRGAEASMRIMREGYFAPMMALMPVDDDEHALAIANDCDHALGASIFTRDTAAAEHLARRLAAGCVVINDMIAPTADPRMPFGGRKHSGFGVTRGPEGLLEMTCIKAVILRRGARRPHFEPLSPRHTDLAASLLATMHSRSWRLRLQHALRAARHWLSLKKDSHHGN